MKKTINILWQSLSDFSLETAKKIHLLSPDKFVINTDGPGSTAKSPINPPTIDNLVSFITELDKLGYKGELVMHPNCESSSYEHDWNGKGGLPSIPASTDSWNVYLDYFNKVQTVLSSSSTTQFSELLIETENSYFTNHDLQTYELFKNIREKLDKNIKLSTTGGWNYHWDRIDGGIDCYYIQMYDMPYPQLSGVNTYSPPQVINLVKNMSDAMHKQVCNLSNPNSNFIFTFCEKGSTPPLDPPMFSTSGSYWSEPQFNEFVTKFKTTYDVENVGIWPCESILKHW